MYLFLFIIFYLLSRDVDVYATLHKAGLCPRSKATGEEVFPLTWSDIVFTTIDMATIAVVAAFTVVAVFTRVRLTDTITSLLGTQVTTSFILD